MDITATANYIHQSPRKVRIVATAVRDLPLTDALNATRTMNAKAAKIVSDVLQSAVANATHNHQIAAESLRIKTLEVGEGPTMKRVRARSRGMANSIHKRTSHVRVVLTDEPAVEKKAVKMPLTQVKEQKPATRRQNRSGQATKATEATAPAAQENKETKE